MPGPFIGRINSIINGGGLYTAMEKCHDLEEVIFSDGIVDDIETELISPLLSATKDDCNRLQLIVKEHAYTLGRYRTILRERGFETTGLKINTQLKDIRAKITGVTLGQNGGFVITMTKDGKDHTWNYDGGLYTVQKIDRQVFPLSLFEIFLALEDFRYDNSSVDRHDAAGQAVETIAQMVRDSGSFPESYWVRYRASTREINTTYAINLSSIPVEVGEYSFFYGVQPSDDVREAIISTMKALPREITDALITNGISIHLENWTSFMQEFHGEKPPMRNGGSAEEDITVNIDHAPQTVAYVLAHEIGHKINELMINKIAGNEHENVLKYHSAKLHAFLVAGHQNSFLRHYSEDKVTEWFADAFAIYYLGKTDLAFRNGLHSLIGGNAVGFQHMSADFRQWDMTGYLLMDKLDQYLQTDYRAENAVPLHGMAFSFTVYAAAEDYALNGKTLQDWRTENFKTYADLSGKMKDRIDFFKSDIGDTGTARVFQTAIIRNPFDDRLLSILEGVVRSPELKKIKSYEVVGETVLRLCRLYPLNILFLELYSIWLASDGKYIEADKRLAQAKKDNNGVLDTDGLGENIALRAFLADCDNKTWKYYMRALTPKRVIHVLDTLAKARTIKEFEKIYFRLPASVRGRMRREYEWSAFQDKVGRILMKIQLQNPEQAKGLNKLIREFSAAKN